MKYAIYIHSEPGIDGYGVIVPDLPGCVSHGDDVEDAYRMACEAVRFHVEQMVADGDPMPSPRPVDTIVRQDDLADYDGDGGYWAFVEVEPTPSAAL